MSEICFQGEQKLSLWPGMKHLRFLLGRSNHVGVFAPSLCYHIFVFVDWDPRRRTQVCHNIVMSKALLVKSILADTLIAF